MQVPLIEASAATLATFRRVWTKVMRSFLLSQEKAMAELWFCPELLGPTFNYARQIRDTTGELHEETDRWREAQALVALAQDCFDQAYRSTGEETVPSAQSSTVTTTAFHN
jgi:hypothetical protein